MRTVVIEGDLPAVLVHAVRVALLRKLLQLQEGTPCADAAALRAQLRDEEEAEAMRAGPAASGTSGYIPSRTFT